MQTQAYALFPTPIGHCGIAWGPHGLTGVQLPEQDEAATRVRMARRFPHCGEGLAPPTVQVAIDAVVALLRGAPPEPVDLSNIVLDMIGVPPFHQRVYALARTMAPGQTMTYGEMARQLGVPGAARAVGQALGANPFAPVVPCHRILAAGGGAGGFSANGGVSTKLRMLLIERARFNGPGLFDDAGTDVTLFAKFTMPTTHLLYLHGFRSSPASNKARMTAAAVARRNPGITWLCPALPASPRQAMDEVLQAVRDWPRDSMAIIGSSLGGFYATWLAERFGCKAALLNPAVRPARDLAAHLGDHTVWHDPEQHFAFDASYIDELLAQEVPHISRPARYFAVIAKGDEVLDWREMTSHYPGASLKLLPAGDHALSDYDQHLDEVLDFLEVRSP